MFAPLEDYLIPARVQQAMNFGKLVRTKTAVKGDAQVIDPYFISAGFKNMNVNPFRQIVTVKTDAIAILDENRRQSARMLTPDLINPIPS